MKPTDQQQKIIDAHGDLVIVANPGSGKTFVLSEKIRKVLPDCIETKGLIAISYTNKASQELKTRCLKNGMAPKASFFGTMDKFYLYEIIIPFAKQLFGIPEDDIKVLKRSDLNDETKEELENLSDVIDPNNPPREYILLFRKLFLKGNIILELVGLLAVYIFNHSQACKNYIKAKYTHIIIDEYQDCGSEQHLLFLKIKAIGLKAIAVGDANQSIFKFSGKSSEFLVDLAKRKDEFQLFPLDYNHRCHPSIINYSLLLLNPNSQLLDNGEIHVHEKLIQGNEISIAQWLTAATVKYEGLYNVTKRNKIGILVRNNRTGNLVHKNLRVPHKYFESTSLDEDFSIWSGIFRNLLTMLFDNKLSKIEFVEEYISRDVNRTKVIGVLRQINELNKIISQSPIDVPSVIEMFVNIGMSLHPAGRNNESLILLKEVLLDAHLLESYKPAAENEMQIMSLHKSKGLEFDVVFHLDLYEWILPKKEINNGVKGFTDLRQDVNLHYVGITRAKKCCVLCHSTKRTNFAFEQKSGNPSEFLLAEYLKKKRIQSPF